MKPEKENLSNILDKMLELRKTEKSYTWMQKAMVVICGIAALIIISFLCVMMYKNNFSIESLLSLLLAFFSIFISAFFYFKASDTSNDFYDKSYDIMKDVSVTLGKIEAQFGEKLNNMNEKISHISYKETETTEKLQSTEDEKQQMIDELFEKAQMGEQEKEQYRSKLQEKESEIDRLQMNLNRLIAQRNEINDYSNDISHLRYNDSYNVLKNNLSERDLMKILNGDIEDLSDSAKEVFKLRHINPRRLLNNDEFRNVIISALNKE